MNCFNKKRRNLSRGSENIILLLIIGLLTINVIYWGNKKEGFHIDEVYSCSQIGNTNYLRTWYDQPGRPYLNNWHDASYFKEFLTVDDDEAFYFIGAWNTAYDNSAHPPLYFVFLHFINSLFFRNTFTKWSGITANIPFYILTLIVLYLLCKKIYRDKWFLSALTVMIYGASAGAVSSVIYMRMYMMFTFFSTSFVYLHFLLFERLIVQKEYRKGCIGLFVILYLNTLMGVLTHYYYLIFAFLVCLFFGILLCMKKKWKYALIYAGCSIGAILTCIFICPDFLNDLLFDSRATDAVTKAKAIIVFRKLIFNHLSGYLRIADKSLCRPIVVLWAILITFIFLIVQKRVWPQLRGKSIIGSGDKKKLLKRVQYNKLLPAIYNTIITKTTGLFSQLNKPISLQPNQIKNIRRIILLKKNKTRYYVSELVTNTSEVVFVFLLLVCILLYFIILTLVAPFVVDRYIMNIFPSLSLCVCFLSIALLKKIIQKRDIAVISLFMLLLLSLVSYRDPGVNYLYPGFNEEISIISKYKGNRAVVVTDYFWYSSQVVPHFLASNAVYQTQIQEIEKLATIKPDITGPLIVYVGVGSKGDADLLIDQISEIMCAKDKEFLFSTSEDFQLFVYRLVL